MTNPSIWKMLYKYINNDKNINMYLHLDRVLVQIIRVFVSSKSDQDYQLQHVNFYRDF